MTTTTGRTATSPFSHLLALVTGNSFSGKRADDEDKPEEGAEDDKPEEGADDDKPEEGAEDDKPEEGADDDKDDKGGKRGRRAKRAESDDDEAEGKAEDEDDDEEMAQARREGYAAAQARGRRIFSAASAGLRPDMAAHLAFNDTRSSADAIAMLDMAAGGAAPAANGSRLGRRMARVVIPNPGASSAAKPGAKSEVDQFVEAAAAAAKKAGI